MSEHFSEKLLGRFWKKVNRAGDDECWEWNAAINGAGYGQFRTEDSSKGPVNAHRVSYEILVGPIEAGLFVDHLCRNRRCVNPRHLEPVTPRINTLRGTAPTAVNAVLTHCRRGHEFTPENTIKHPLGRNCRSCRTARYKQMKS